MKGVLMFMYSIVAYVIAFASIIYWILSLSNLIPEISIDQEPRIPIAQAIVNNLILVAHFGVQHSVMSRTWFKEFFTRYFPKPIERSTYVLVSGLLLYKLVIQWQPIGGVIWQASTDSFWYYLFNILFFLGWAIMLVSTFLINHFDFFGLRQTFLELQNKPYKSVQFQINGFYKYVRHPLYLGILIGIWFTPTMTITHLVMAIAFTIYVFIGIKYEELDLEEEHHMQYILYKKRKPKLIPFTKKATLKFNKLLKTMKMKTTLFLTLALLLSVVTINAQTIGIPDSNFEQALIDLNLDSNGFTGNILLSDAQAVTNLPLNNKGIVFLDGISAFTNLTTLVVSNNSLLNLDLSSNTALTYLDCSNNLISNLDLSSNTLLGQVIAQNNQLSNINVTGCMLLTDLFISNNNLESLDISDNVLLEELYCVANELTALDTSNNPNLEILYAYDNSITSLDVSQNSQLSQLFVSHNALSNLNLQNGNNANITFLSTLENPQLTCIEVDDVAYSTNNWSDIDPQSYFALDCTDAFIDIPDSNFEQALIDAGFDTNGLTGNILVTDTEAITTLEISNNSISDLTGIEGFVNLEYIECNFNNVTQLDLSNNTLLTEIYFNSNALSVIDVSNLSLLEVLEVRNNNLESLDITTNLALTVLRIEDNQLESINLANNTLLETFFSNNNSLNGIDFTNNTNLINVALNDNFLEYLDVSTLVNLEYLICDDNQISSIDLDNNSQLETFHAKDNNLYYLSVKNGNNENISSLATLGNPNLDCINVDNYSYAAANWVDVDANTGFSTNCAGLTIDVPDANFEQALIDLGIDNNGPTGNILITDAEAVSTLDVFNRNISDLTGIEGFINLETLDFSSNSVTQVDLSSNPLLTFLDCSNNLLQVLDLSSQPFLEELDASFNNLESINLSNNPLLNYLHVPYNQLESIDVSNNPLLEILYCSDNTLNAIDLTNNPSLQHLSLGYNALESLDVSASTNLEFLNCNNNQIQSLDLSLNGALTAGNLANNDLHELNLQNGANTNIISISTLGNPNLFCVLVDDGAYSTTNWTQIDPQTNFSTNCTATINIPDDNFETALIDLGIDTNGLNGNILQYEAEAITELDVSNKSITSLLGIEGFINLTILRCQDNNISSLDLNQNTGLTFLNCRNNNLTSLDLSNNTLLEDLNCFNNQITALDLSGNSVLGFLLADDNNLSSLNVRNGNNTNVTFFSVLNNSNLTCVEVDDEVYSAANWTDIDAQTSFSENCGTLGLEDVSKLEGVTLFPNPTSDTVYVKGLQEETTIALFDINGRLILNQTISSNQGISVANIPSGLYMVSITNSNGKTVKKLLKQ